MPFLIRLLCITATSFCVGTTVLADTKLVYEMNGAETFSIAIRGDLLRWEFAGGPRNLMTIAYDHKQRQLGMIDEKRKRIYLLNDKTLAAQRERDARRKRAMASARRDYKNMSPERRRQFEKHLPPWQLKRLRGDGNEGKDPVTIRKGEKMKIQGYACQVFDTILNEQPSSRVCVADRSAVGMSKDDYATLTGMFQFLGALTKTPRMASIHFARNLKGVPLQMTDNRRDKTQTVRTISLTALSDDEFKLPPYEQIDPMARRKRRR